MKLGKESRYASEGLAVLASKPFGTIMQLHDIAEAAHVPPSFLAKIFQKLHRAKLLTSSRGALRGYALARRPRAIKMKEVIAAVEGADVFEHCIFWSDRCADRSPCPMHFKWQRVRRSIAGLMERTSLADLAQKKARKQ
jgi:Rrf2 family protein